MDIYVVKYIVVLAAAAAAGSAFGAVWRRVLAKPRMAAVGKTEPLKPRPLPFIIDFAVKLVIAFSMSGALAPEGNSTVIDELITAMLGWSAVLILAMFVTHRAKGAPWSLTLIDGGHWVGAFVVIGFVLGLFWA